MRRGREAKETGGCSQKIKPFDSDAESALPSSPTSDLPLHGVRGWGGPSTGNHLLLLVAQDHLGYRWRKWKTPGTMPIEPLHHPGGRGGGVVPTGAPQGLVGDSGLTMPSLLSPQVTPQGSAGTLPMSQASSSLSTTGQGGQKTVGAGWGGRTPRRPEPKGCKWLRVSMGLKAEPGDEGAGRTDGRGQTPRSWPEKSMGLLKGDVLGICSWHL